MNDSKKQFVEQLLAADRLSADLRRHYEKEVHAMLEKSIGPRQRRLCLVAAVLLDCWGVLEPDGTGDSCHGCYRKDTSLEPLPAFLILALCVLGTGLALLLVAGCSSAPYWKVFSTSATAGGRRGPVFMPGCSARCSCC